MQTKSIMRPHTIELMKPHTHPDAYVDAVKCYEGNKDIANYFRYTEENQLEGDLYFLQLTDNRFSLVLNNRDWLTNDLQEIIEAMQWYNEPEKIEAERKKRILTPAEEEEVADAMEAGINEVWGRMQTKFGVPYGDVDIALHCRIEKVMEEIKACVIEQINCNF